jgi:preprotein translocase subunit SecE
MRQILRREPQPAIASKGDKTRRASKATPGPNKTLRFFSEIRAEIRKVTRPTREQTLKLTVLVTFVSIVVGLLLGAIDYVFDQAFEVLLGGGRL